MSNEQMTLRSLVGLGHALEQAASPAAITTVLADAARGMVPFGACALVLREPTGWAVWRAPAGRPEALSERRDLPPEASAIMDRFMALEGPLRIDDLLGPPWNSTAHRDILWKDGTRAALVLPLIAAGQHLGSLVFTAFRPNVYTQIDLEFVGLIAWLVALTVRVLPPAPQEALDG
jgi:GAF domain-containing protein